MFVLFIPTLHNGKKIQVFGIERWNYLYEGGNQNRLEDLTICSSDQAAEGETY